MPDLRRLFNLFSVDKPLGDEDGDLYVDLSGVRGENKVARKLVTRIKNAGTEVSHQLVMGHTKCGKSTEVNRTAYILEHNEDYATVRFDMANIAGRGFEYTTVLLIMADQVVQQLADRKPPIKIKATAIHKLAQYLEDKEIADGWKTGVEGKGAAQVEAPSGLLHLLLGKLGIGVDLGGSFQRSRQITIQVERDISGFIDAFKDLIAEAKKGVIQKGKKGLVIICDGCDKLVIDATDDSGRSYDLQTRLFVDHEPDLRSVPCHVIYTVPISIPANLGDIWEQNPEFIPAIPVSRLPGIEEKYPLAGRESLREVVRLRLKRGSSSIDGLFSDPNLLDQLIDVSGGHISDLLLLVREAVLEAQIDEVDQIEAKHIRRSILRRALEYSSLIEGKHLPILAEIDRHKTRPGFSREYRDLIFKRLVLEYLCSSNIEDNRVDLHPLVAASEAYKRYHAASEDGGMSPS